MWNTHERTERITSQFHHNGFYDSFEFTQLLPSTTSLASMHKAVISGFGYRIGHHLVASCNEDGPLSNWIWIGFRKKDKELE
jgi:hypothetical protein